MGFQASRYAQESVESEECNGKVSTNLYFICDPDSIWSADDSDVTRHVMASQQDLSDPCTVRTCGTGRGTRGVGR